MIMVKGRTLKRMSPSASQGSEVVDTYPVYKRVSHSGNTAYLTVTRLIPSSWKIVELTATQPVDGVITLKVRKVV